jgi:PPP family 3-phenylpropionic acid transporter
LEEKKDIARLLAYNAGMTFSALPDAFSGVPRFRRLALVVCMFLITASMGFLQPFVPLYMEASGLSRQQIGLVTGLGAGLAILVQPLLGRLSDRLDARRPFMSVTAALTALAYLSYRSAHGVWAFTLLTALGLNGTFYLNTVGGVLIGRLVQGARGGGSAYARYRVWGSVGYIVVALLAGWLLNRGLPGRGGLGRAALDPVFTYGPLLFLIIAIISWLVPDSKRAIPDAVSSPFPPEPASHTSLTANVRFFLLAFFLYQFGLYGASAYLSLFLKTLGATPLWITGTFAAGVVCEVLVMTQVGRWTDRVGRRPALAIAFILMPLRLLCYIPAPNPLWVLAVQTLHGLNFGIMGAIAVVFINDSADDSSRGLAQARLAGVGGLATAFAPAVCGWLVQHRGMGAMFAAMSAVGAAAALIFLTRVRESYADARLLQEGGGHRNALLRWLSGPSPEAAPSEQQPSST